MRRPRTAAPRRSPGGRRRPDTARGRHRRTGRRGRRPRRSRRRPAPTSSAVSTPGPHPTSIARCPGSTPASSASCGASTRVAAHEPVVGVRCYVKDHASPPVDRDDLHRLGDPLQLDRPRLRHRVLRADRRPSPGSRLSPLPRQGAAIRSASCTPLPGSRAPPGPHSDACSPIRTCGAKPCCRRWSASRR